jgi:hypothetical protein
MPYAALELAATAALGLYAGAMLTEAGVLVPYWRSLPADAFFAWYRANDRRLLRFFGAVTAIAGLLALAHAIAALAAGAADRVAAVVAAIGALATVAMFPLHFARANARFSAASIAPGDLPAALARWDGWHRARTAISLATFAVALLSR